MSTETLSYRGLADLTLIYDPAPGLGHIIERPGVAVVVTRHSATAPVSVLVDPRLRVAECDGLPLRRAVVVLPDGRALSGAVQELAESGDYFELAAVSPATQGTRYE